MNLTSTVTGATQVVAVDADRIDASMAIQFKEEMRKTTDGGPDRVVLDLRQVEFIDSSGLGAIVASMKQLGSDRRLDLAGLNPVVEKVFRLTRMDSVFNLFSSVGEALAEDAGGAADRDGPCETVEQ